MAKCQVCEEERRRRKCSMCGAMACIYCYKEIADDYGASKCFCTDCAEVYQAGHDCGSSAASWMDMPEIGYVIPLHLDWVGYKVVDEENQGDVFVMLAGEAESHARQFSPWEFIAKAINDRCADLDHDDLWELYDLGVEQGIAAEWAKRDPRED